MSPEAEAWTSFIIRNSGGVLEWKIVKLQTKRPGLLRRGVVLQHDNAIPHSANLTQQWPQRYGWEILPFPAHSPDLAPSDFHLFGPLKRHLGGMAFEIEDDLISELRNWFDNLDVDFFRVRGSWLIIGLDAPHEFFSWSSCLTMAYPVYPNSGPRAADECLSKIDLYIECKNLLNMDIASKSDPCAVLYMSRKGGRMEEVGRTENVKNCLDPKFSTCIRVDYYFEEVQNVTVAVYDVDNKTHTLSDDDFLGQLNCTLGQLVSNSPYTKPLLLRNGSKAGQGTVTVRSEEAKEGGEVALITFNAKKLDNKDFMGKSDPYLEIQKPTIDGSWQIVHRTEVVKNNLNPSWRPVTLPVHNLCGGNRQQQIKIDCYDWDSDGSHDYIGGFTTTLDEMLKAANGEVSFPCINAHKKAKKKNYSNSGLINITSCKLVKEHTFLEYIFGGMQINFTVGIDFTASNGNPSQSTSLHYINPYEPNEYMAAIKAVGAVCQDYDSDKLFPALGFGAKIPPATQVYHEFAINFNAQNPFCAGVEGILAAYTNCIQYIQLYGPTNVSPIINHVARFAQAAQQEEPMKGAHAYSVLLLLTDGVLSDMGDTKASIVAASKLPMSLIIVGVGGADFTDMNELDGDNGVLRSPQGEPARRDIVQFVPFREFKRSAPAELARHVLAEIPKQVTEYYKMRGLKPNQQHPAPAATPMG
ncbi:copine-3 [Plakobranchus ocellatus]|uniref:Copine-3 n=1 Tax=Plakobranchus ocellatus TaxID=259542 RepID=A0AAV3ZSS2_9GAST|nr:copine-3 [Plakobranchus ocellatus]